MVDTFDLGETVVCSITVKDADGALQNAATSMSIVIDRLSPNYAASVVASTAMTNDDTGLYHYDFSTSSANAGLYRINYTAVDGTRTTKHVVTFVLE